MTGAAVHRAGATVRSHSPVPRATRAPVRRPDGSDGHRGRRRTASLGFQRGAGAATPWATYSTTLGSPAARFPATAGTTPAARSASPAVTRRCTCKLSIQAAGPAGTIVYPRVLIYKQDFNAGGPSVYCEYADGATNNTDPPTYGFEPVGSAADDGHRRHARLPGQHAVVPRRRHRRRRSTCPPGYYDVWSTFTFKSTATSAAIVRRWRAGSPPGPARGRGMIVPMAMPTSHARPHGPRGLGARLRRLGHQPGRVDRRRRRRVAAGAAPLDRARRRLRRHGARLRRRAQREARRPGRPRVAARARREQGAADELGVARARGRPGRATPIPGGWIVECTERSLRNLGLETIDLHQLHVWTPGWAGEGDWLEAVDRLKAEGKIRFFGVSLNDHAYADAKPLLDSGVVDALQVIYNAFDQSAEDELLPAALAANVGMLARVPLDEGGLSGEDHARHDVPRRRLPQRLLRRRPQARGVGARERDRGRLRRAARASCRRWRCATSCRTRPSRP